MALAARLRPLRAFDVPTYACRVCGAEHAQTVSRSSLGERVVSKRRVCRACQLELLRATAAHATEVRQARDRAQTRRRCCLKCGEWFDVPRVDAPPPSKASELPPWSRREHCTDCWPTPARDYRAEWRSRARQAA